MGVNKLLKYVASAIRKSFISEFRGKTIGIDISGWIHKGLYHGDYISYIQVYVDIMTRYKCILVFVFDGKPPQEKNETIAQRYPANGSSGKCIPRITAAIVAHVKAFFDLYENVIVVQAPSEADPQLAFLAREKLVDIVATDDSDLIVYGLEQIILKLKPYGGCEVFEWAELPDSKVKSNVKLFRWACIVAGCDYLPGGLKGIGVYRSFSKICTAYTTKTPEDAPVLKYVFNVDDKFIERFRSADSAFLFQDVLDPRTGKIRSLTL